MRLDKYLSKAKFITRNEARKLIKSGNVKVNNQVVKKQNYLLDVDFDIVLFNDEKLEYSKFHYYMLNKPQGVISATVDKNYKTVRDLIDTPLDLHPVGRLDKDTEGLLLLMDNGLLSHRLTSPKYNIEKKYYVKLKHKLDKSMVDSFLKGLEILDGNINLFITKPAKLEIMTDYEAFVTLTEGKFHQVKRMFEKTNNEVEYLKRVKFGDITLDSKLALGEYRQLTKEEIAHLLSLCGLK